MSHLYLFDADGRCFTKVTTEGAADDAKGIAERNHAATYVLSDEDMPVTHAFQVAGALVNVPPAPRQLDYREKRLLAYPPIVDQLDAIWKGGAEAEAMRAQVQAVKAKYPKDTKK